LGRKTEKRSIRGSECTDKEKLGRDFRVGRHTTSDAYGSSEIGSLVRKNHQQGKVDGSEFRKDVGMEP